MQFDHSNKSMKAHLQISQTVALCCWEAAKAADTTEAKRCSDRDLKGPESEHEIAISLLQVVSLTACIVSSPMFAFRSTCIGSLGNKRGRYWKSAKRDHSQLCPGLTRIIGFEASKPVVKTEKGSLTVFPNISDFEHNLLIDEIRAIPSLQDCENSLFS